MAKTDLLNDHRDHRLLPDKDNQILWWKAMRDRFGNEHGYRSYLCSPRSEDILTWTVFRTLEQAGSMAKIDQYFGVKGADELKVLYWMFHAQHLHCPEQTALWELLREVDGGLGGQATEPDIVLIGQHQVCFVEAKLGEPGKKPTLWFGRDAKRLPLYERYLEERRGCLFRRELSDGEKEEFYQLIRNVFYSYALAAKLEPSRMPLVVCLVNEHNRTAPTHSIQEAFDEFCGLLCEDGPFTRSNLVLRTWQGLAEALREGDDHEQRVADFLYSHPCLASLGCEVQSGRSEMIAIS